VTEYFVSANVANMYAEPQTSSEMVSQAICGAHATLIASDGEFALIKTEDRYQGWVRQSNLVSAWDTSDYLKTATSPLFTDVHESPSPRSDLRTKLPCSSRVFIAHAGGVGDYVPIMLPDRVNGYVHRLCLDVTQNEPDANSAPINPPSEIEPAGYLRQEVIAAIGERVVDIGRRFIGTPYLWGGTTPFGIDCSGFVQLCYRLSGIQLLRDAHPQFQDKRFFRVDEGATFDEAPLLCGDLVAFSNTESGRVTHIGLADGAGRFLHSSGGRGVYFDWCTSPRYSATFVGAVRLSSDADLTIDSA